MIFQKYLKILPHYIVRYKLFLQYIQLLSMNTIFKCVLSFQSNREGTVQTLCDEATSVSPL